MNLKRDIQKCPDCKGKVEYDFCMDRWVCDGCGDIDLFSPKDRKKYSNEFA